MVGDRIAAPDESLRTAPGHRAVDPDGFGLDMALNSRPRFFRQELGQHLVESFAGERVGHGQSHGSVVIVVDHHILDWTVPLFFKMMSMMARK